MSGRGFAAVLALIIVAVAGVTVGGCFAPPEACHGCRAGLIDTQIDAPVETGQGGDAGTGGAPFGTGGAIDAGGAGGVTGVGGAPGVGGAIDAGAGGAIDAGGAGGAPGVGGAPGAGGAIDAGAGGAIDAAGAGGAPGVGGAPGAGGAIDVDLAAWYRFDDVGAVRTTAADSSGNGRTATLTSLAPGSANFSPTAEVGTGALNLMSTTGAAGGYASLPTALPAMGATTAITISCWVNVRTVRSWQRIFDFGSNNTTYMFLTAHASGLTVPNVPRFAITQTGNGPGAEQTIVMTNPAPLSVGAWHHLAVVLGTTPPGSPSYTGTLYVDKLPAGANTAMTLRPSDLGNGVNNWIGRSEFGDPLFDGLIDDFRVYRRALTAAEIQALP